MHKQDGNLKDPLQQVMLPYLPVSTLAHLRATTRQCKDLVDEQTGPTWKNAAAILLGAGTLPTSTDGHAVQFRLQQHADILKRLTSGKTSQLIEKIMTINSVLWMKDCHAWSPV